MVGTKQYWYIVYWSNEIFKGTKYNPSKPGQIFGVDEKYQEEHRMGLDEKTRNFVIVEKFKFLKYDTPAAFKKWLEATEG